MYTLVNPVWYEISGREKGSPLDEWCVYRLLLARLVFDHCFAGLKGDASTRTYMVAWMDLI